MNEEEKGIIEALKTENLRVSTGSRWLVWESAFEEWAVYEHRPYQRGSSVMCSTPLESVAVRWLLGER